MRSRSLVAIPLLWLAMTPSLVACQPRAQSIDLVSFGTNYLGQSTNRTIELRNIGNAPLHILGVESPDSAFVVTGFRTTDILPGTWGSIEVRFDRLSLGVKNVGLEIDTDDPDQPVVVAPLTGVVLTPGSISIAADNPTVTLKPRETRAATFTVRNTGTLPLSFNANVEGWHVTASGDPEFLRIGPRVALPDTLYDGLGRMWDIQGKGTIGRGTDNTFFGALDRFGFVAQESAVCEDARTRRIEPDFGSDGIAQARKIYVSPTEGYARWLELVWITADVPRSHDIDVRSNFGWTGGPEPFFSRAWGVIDDGFDGAGAQAVGQVFANPRDPTEAGFTVAPVVSRAYWSLSLGPHAAAAALHFAVQRDTREEAIAACESLMAVPVDSMPGLSALERRLLEETPLVNCFVSDPGVSVPPGQSATLHVTYVATPEVGLPAHVGGTVVLRADDPSVILASLPVAFDVSEDADTTNTPVDSLPPPPPPPPAQLALRGFWPNPLRGTQGGRVELALAPGEPGRCEIFDVRGRRVWAKTIDPAHSTLTIAPGELPASGVVWIRLTQGGRSVVRKGLLLP